MEGPSRNIDYKETRGENRDWKKVAERYVRLWLEARSGISRAHSWDHAKMIAQMSSTISKEMGMDEDEANATFIAALAHDAIQPALIPSDKKEGDATIRQKLHEAWNYDPEGSEAIESAKAARHVLSNTHVREKVPFLDETMVGRVVESIAGHGVRIGPHGELQQPESEPKFKDWDPIAKALYTSDKLVNQEPTMLFALSNFTPTPGSNKREFTDIDRTDPKTMEQFLDAWFGKRAHLMEQEDLVELMKKGDPRIADKIDFLKRSIDEYRNEMTLIEGRPDLLAFANDYGMLSVLRFSQDLGRDEVNVGELKIAEEFVRHIEEAAANKDEIIGHDEDKARIFAFAEDLKDRLAGVLEQYGTSA